MRCGPHFARADKDGCIGGAADAAGPSAAPGVLLVGGMARRADGRARQPVLRAGAARRQRRASPWTGARQGPPAALRGRARAGQGSTGRTHECSARCAPAPCPQTLLVS